MPAVTNSPIGILQAWTAFEALSPPSFRKPEDLVNGDRRAVARLDGGELPWSGEGEPARPRTRLHYQILLGTVDLEASVAALLTRYSDSRIERPGARGEALLAIITVDRHGRPVEAPAATVSSFGWAVPRALEGNIEALGDWRATEGRLTKSLDELLRPDDADEAPVPLDKALIQSAYDWLVTALGLPPELVSPPKYALRVYESVGSADSPDPPLLPAQ